MACLSFIGDKKPDSETDQGSTDQQTGRSEFSKFAQSGPRTVDLRWYVDP